MKSKFTSKISWREKLEKVKEYKIVNIPPKMQNRFGKGKMLIPKPLDIDALIKKVKKGKLITMSEIRKKLEKDFEVNVACPITTGIFIRIISEASEEDFEKGKKKITPYWRVIRDDGSSIAKFPAGNLRHAERLINEGYTLVKSKNKKTIFVKDFEKHLMHF